MLSRTDLQRLAAVRLEDATLLLQLGKSSSAYYLAGYSVELSLKACISRLFHSDSIPDKGLVNAIYTHSLESLMNSSGLLPALNDHIKANPVFGAYWGITTKWSESSRYEFWDPVTAATLLEAISDENDGVFPWVKKHW